MKFQSLTNLCNSTLKFSENMVDVKAGFNLTWLLEGGLRIYMELSKETLDYIDTTSITYEEFSRFTWEPVLFENDKLEINIMLGHPILYSQGDGIRDKIVIEVIHN